MSHRNNNGTLDNVYFAKFLEQLTACALLVSIDPVLSRSFGASISSKLVDVCKFGNISFDSNLLKFTSLDIKVLLQNFNFLPSKQATKAFLAWWAFTNHFQHLLSYVDTVWTIEHIYSKRKAVDNQFDFVDNIGNLVFLEKGINIRASDYRFVDKVKYYTGQVNSGRNRKPICTQIRELIDLSHTHTSFTESDIKNREQLMYNTFISFLQQHGLLKS